ncbi:MAG TPA: hypothetical protein VGO37_10585 [Steroidobacteraceae bacterium]|jgi:hypothetical protein|nr:hypothetical protein [Steroidobacteraceae bacterium]
MKRRLCPAFLSACLAAGSAMAGDQLDVIGMLDVRWINATGETSYLNGGLGALRFDPDHEGFRLGRAFLAPRLRLTDTVTLHTVIDAYGDHDRNPVDLSEFWAEVRPFPTSPLRWRARIGAFYMPVSLENRGPGWSDAYSITPSALNTWMGEEFRTIGAEVEARWLGSSTEYLGDFAVVAAAYGWNDPAGVLISDRGFALSDRASTLFGGLGRPPQTFYHEIDRKPGYYGGLSWRHHDRLEIRALRYDNKGDPSASTVAGGGAWRTRFSSFGARLEPTAHWTFIAQYVNGDTVIGSDADADEQFRMTYHVAFGLASYERGPDRLTARFDDFGTHQLSGFYGLPSNESGHAWTAAWTRDLGEHWQLAAEWIRVWSRFPPRASFGVPATLLESQVQIAMRFRFHLSI